MPSRDSMASVTAPPGLPVPPGGGGNAGSSALPAFGVAGGQRPGASTVHSAVPHGPWAPGAPDPIQALSVALAQLSLGRGTQAAYAGPLLISASQGTRGSTQPGLAAAPAVFHPGPATAPGVAAAPHMPGAVPRAGPCRRQPLPSAGSTRRVPIRMGLSGAPSGFWRADDIRELCCRFGALSIKA